MTDELTTAKLWTLPEDFLLALDVWAEARSEPLVGRLAVAHVPLNRVGDSRYGMTVRQVLLKPAQFSGFNDPAALSDVKPWDTTFLLCWSVARLALNGYTVDPTQGATHYYAEWIDEPSWAKNMEVVAHIGQHIFLKE